ncbi:MAG: ABC transporter ATP-binding protein [Methanocorpusculum sp.]|nr:ABC transporter ATP-binding protein [Methanocorpusculum sp.]
MTTELSAENLSVSYGDHLVFENLSLAVEQGGFIGILGPNGCGKTTFLRTLSRVLTPDSGTVFIENVDIKEFNVKALARTIGCVSQETSVSFNFTVKDIVMMGRHPHIGRLSPLSEEDLKIVDEAMKTTNVSNLADRFITEISGGERQRVLIARSIAQQPKILLLDEPTSHLDINHQIDILSMIQALTPKITVIGVFHDLNLASHFCDKIVLMEKGKIIKVGTPSEVLTTELIKKSFSIKMMVTTHPVTGKPYLVPEYGVFSSPNSKKIHVISGGGSGTEIFYMLSMYGYSVTAGVLSTNDSDFVSAKTLGLEVISEPPFTEISEESIVKQKQLINESDAVIVTDMPVGAGNLSNIEALKDISAEIYFIRSFSDYTGGKASEIRESLIKNGAEVADSIPELLKKL